MKSGKPRRLSCVVEGHGEVHALPNLCLRVANYLGVTSSAWIVDEPIRASRSQLVDETQPSPSRPPRKDMVERLVELARRDGNADGVLLTCDADDDCAAVWGPAAAELASARLRGGAVMIVREYEAWLLAAQSNGREWKGKPIESLRSPKEALRSIVPRYKPTTHQLELTRKIDVARLRELSDSFDKFVRTLAGIFETACPPRKVSILSEPSKSPKSKARRSR